MILNPSQRQLDLRHKKDLVIEVTKTPGFRIIEKLLDMLTGNTPEYVTYNGKQYMSNELIIYTKEEVASMRSEEIKAIVGPDSARYKTNTTVTLQGNINRVAITCGNNTIRMDYNDLYMFLKQIENQYTTAIRNNTQFQYESVALYRLTSFKHNEDYYEFVNNFVLEINIVKDIDTHKYTATETALQIELTEQFDNQNEADAKIKEVIAARLNLLRTNKSADLLFKYKKLEDEIENSNKIKEKSEKL